MTRGESKTPGNIFIKELTGGGPVTMSAISAVDTALWDLKAKTRDVPLGEWLGGASRDGVLVYGHASGRGRNTAKAVSEYVALGYKAIRAQSGFPDCKQPMT